MTSASRSKGEDVARAGIIRLAELWYHGEGFVSSIPTGLLAAPAPWIEAALVEDHSGDCTKQPWSCMRCHAEEQMQIAEWVYPHLAATSQIRKDRTDER